MNLRARFNTAKNTKASPQKSAQLFVIFEQALAAGDRKLALEARLAEGNSRTSCADDERAMLAVAWCAAEYSAHKEELKDFFKNIVWDAAFFPTIIANNINIPIEKIFESLHTYRELLRENGYTDRSYYEESITPFLIIGEIEKAQEAVEKAKKEIDNGFCNFPNYFLVEEFRVAVRQKRSTEAKRIFENIDIDDLIKSWQSTVYEKKAILCVLEKNISEAQEYIQIATKTGKEKSTQLDVDLWGTSIMINILAQDESAALQQWEEIVEYVPSTYCQFCILAFFKASRDLFEHVSQKTKSVSLRVPDSVEWYDASGLYTTATLAQYFSEQAALLAVKIDTRNKNTYHSDTLYSLI